MAEQLHRSETDPETALACLLDAPQKGHRRPLLPRPLEDWRCHQLREGLQLQGQGGAWKCTRGSRGPGPGAQASAATLSQLPRPPCLVSLSDRISLAPGSNAEAEPPDLRTSPVRCEHVVNRTNHLTHESFALGVRVPVNGNMEIPAHTHVSACVHVCTRVRTELCPIPTH